MDYKDRVSMQRELHKKEEWELLGTLQRICPQNYYVIQIEATLDTGEHGNRCYPAFLCTVHNGDDNVTAVKDTIGAAVAQVISYLLNGSIYPLGGGNKGRFIASDMPEKRPFTDQTNSGTGSMECGICAIP